MAINETVLEMHFHRALMDAFRSTLGVGATGVTFFKYSPQKECFVGFDQAWIMQPVSDDQLYVDLKTAAQQNSYQLGAKYTGYFLQYKVVKRMVRRWKTHPLPTIGVPFGRVTLSTQANPNTGLSQHELLFNLCKNTNALVYYACPSIFDKAELYREQVDIASLHLVDVSSCPNEYKDNKRHHLYFELPSMESTWCSEPMSGRSIGVAVLVKQIADRLSRAPQAEAAKLVECLDYLRGERRPRGSPDLQPAIRSNEVLESLTILRTSAAPEKSGRDHLG